MNHLDVALHWNMNPAEAKAYQIALIWISLSKKIFPNFNHPKYPLTKSGDPRKSLLFKYCFKLYNETKGLIPEEEYSLYITAQMNILKAITNGNLHSQISPQILVGPKAWKRWKLWKRKYDQRGEVVLKNENSPDMVVKNALLSTKEHLTLSGVNCAEKLEEAILNNNILRWFTLGKISPYFIALSKYEINITNLDLEIYRNVSSEIILYFKELFPDF